MRSDELVVLRVDPAPPVDETSENSLNEFPWFDHVALVSQELFPQRTISAAPVVVAVAPEESPVVPIVPVFDPCVDVFGSAAHPFVDV